MDESNIPNIPSSFVIVSGCATVLLASALAYVLLDTRNKNSEDKTGSNGASRTDGSTGPKGSFSLDKNLYPGGQVTVYFGTQTGTSESFARQLEREGPEHGFLVHVVDLEDTPIDGMVSEERKNADTGRAIAVVLSATYGEGEAPDNAVVFSQALKEKAGTEIIFDESTDINEPEKFLTDLDFCVFGLGNRQYDHFNAMGKFFDHALDRSGAKRIVEIGLGDDDADLEADFENWKDNQFWPTLKKLYLPDSAILRGKLQNGESHTSMPDCQYVVEYFDDHPKAEKLKDGEIHSSAKHYFTAVDCPVKSVRELRTAEDPGSTVHVEIDISKSSELKYETADNLAVLPVNDAAVVEAVASALGYDLDTYFKLKPAPGHDWHGAPFPMPLTVRECLTRYCDLTGAPRRSDLKLLAAYARDSVDRQALKRMSSKEGKTEYREKILDRYVGLADILKLCPSIQIPLEHFINVCSPLQSRFFTISSSSSVFTKEVHITVAVTEETKPDGTPFHGLCSTYLSRFAGESGLVRVFVRPSTFRLPVDVSRPVLMIGPGTGIAPMRAFLQERAEQKKKNSNVGKNILYFGCKREDQDFIYRDELEAFRECGVLDELHVAFSRQSDQKVYVQHLLDKNSQDTWRLIDGEGAYVYVCGAVKMGHDVSETIKKIVQTEGNMSVKEANDYVSGLSRDGRYVQELWA